MQTPRPPNFESLPYAPQVVGSFFPVKMRERMNLKVHLCGEILSLRCVFLNLNTGAKTVLGIVATPFRRTKVNGKVDNTSR